MSIEFTKVNYFHALTVSFSETHLSFWILCNTFFGTSGRTSVLEGFGEFPYMVHLGPFTK